MKLRCGIAVAVFCSLTHFLSAAGDTSAAKKDALPAIERLAVEAATHEAGPEAAGRMRAFASEMRSKGSDAWRGRCSVMYAMARRNEFTPPGADEVLICFFTGEDCRIVRMEVGDESGKILATTGPLRQVARKQWGDGVFYCVTGLYLTTDIHPVAAGETPWVGPYPHLTIPLETKNTSLRLIGESGFVSEPVHIRIWPMAATTPATRPSDEDSDLNLQKARDGSEKRPGL